MAVRQRRSRTQKQPANGSINGNVHATNGKKENGSASSSTTTTIPNKKKKHGSRGKKDREGNSSTTNQESKSKAKGMVEMETEDEVETSLLWTFVSHPIVVMTAVVMVPYAAYVSYLWIHLQRPDLLQSMGVNLRPAVPPEGIRQMLVVGPMGSGTVQVAAELSSSKTTTAFQLEVGHETMDTRWSFVRDGTVSWFHLVRFILPSAETNDKDSGNDSQSNSNSNSNSHSHSHKIQDPPKAPMEVIRKICLEDPGRMGFHPAMHGNERGCSYRSRTWSKCWAAECADRLYREWGCAVRNDCETPFATILHQARNPLRNVESLVAKFCPPPPTSPPTNATGTRMRMHPSFLRFADAVFYGVHNFTAEETCLGAAAHFVLQYHRTLLAYTAYASSSSSSSSSADTRIYTYRIEEVGPCDVARLAGLASPETTVYQPNHDTYRTLCESNSTNNSSRSNSNHNGNNNNTRTTMGQTHNRRNVDGSIKFTLADLRTVAGQPKLEKAMTRLYRDLGYDPSLER